MTPRTAFPLLLLLAACGQPPLRMAVPSAPAPERIASAYSTVEVLDISLPAYAEEERIFVQSQGGALTAVPGAIWADDPARAMTLELSRALGDLTGARVAPDPWPFDEPAEARVDVRVAEFAPDLTRSEFVLRGQYFIAAFDGSDRARDFRVTAPLSPDPGPAAIAAARSAATAALAREIASDGLR